MPTLLVLSSSLSLTLPVFGLKKKQRSFDHPLSFYPDLSASPSFTSLSMCHRSLSISPSVLWLIFLSRLVSYSFELIHKAKLLAWIYITFFFLHSCSGVAWGKPHNQEMDVDCPWSHSLQTTRLSSNPSKYHQPPPPSTWLRSIINL